jgi:hypothetical protein
MGSSKYSFRGWFLRDTAVDSLRKSTYSPRRLHHLFRAGKGPRKRITRKGNTRRLQAVDGGAATPVSEGGLRSCLPLGVGPDSGAIGLKPTQRREISGRVVDSPSSGEGAPDLNFPVFFSIFSRCGWMKIPKGQFQFN